MFIKNRHDGGGGQSDSSMVLRGGSRRDIGEKVGGRNLGKFGRDKRGKKVRGGWEVAS